MSTTISFRFPWGRYHGTPWGHNVNEGSVDWPPEPWRILRTLYATWKNRAPELDQAIVESVLVKLVEPPSYELPPFVLAHTRHYMPDNKDGTDKVFDAFAVLERGAQLLVTWSVDLTEPEREALAHLSSLIPYLGRAESICDARLEEREPALADLTARPLGVGEPGVVGGERVRLLAPAAPLDLEALTVRTAEVRKGRQIVPPCAAHITYERPPEATPTRDVRAPERAQVTAVRWSIVANALPSVKAAVAMGDALRSACMSRFGSQNDGAVSPILAGKSAEGEPLSGHRHVHYLAFASNTGDRLLDTVVAWSRDPLPEDVLQALGSVERLHGRGFARSSGFRPCRLGLEAFGSVEEIVPELARRSSVWESLTPFAPPRHCRPNRDWYAFVPDEIQRELGFAGFPEAVSVSLLPGDWLGYHRHRRREKLRTDARRAIGASLVFAEPVQGPMCLGALSHFGLGLFVPSGP
ncbi:MAG: type I-U CRISPR-associated protein Cas5/Cas6 [Actinobacteria bacterium]|nr:type I-U CRISPR-associated protein Cas5/Cas6 [Actinomycetota bacterium]